MLTADSAVKEQPAAAPGPGAGAGAGAGFVPPAAGWLRLGPIHAVPRLLREHGVAPEPVLCTVGLAPADFDDLNHPIAFTAMGRLLTECAERTACPHFGLFVGAQAGAESLGIVGDLLRAAPDVGAALRSLIVYFHLHDQGGVPALSVEGTVAQLSYGIYQPGTTGVAQIHDAAVAIGMNIVRALCGARWRPSQVLLPRARPAEVAPYRRVFGVVPRFDAERAALVFAADGLRRPLPGANAALFAYLEAEAAALEAAGRGDPLQQLRRVLRSLLTTEGGGGLAQVADLFAVHRRTLNRRLASRGTNFRALVDEVRFEIACQLLGETALSVAAIAAALEYADASAFTRAFKRWAGQPPAAWRGGRDGEHCAPRAAPRGRAASRGGTHGTQR